jgi:Protein of unknown function (DUF3800)
MKLIFFDEAKNDGNYPHYHIGGFCVDEDHVMSIENEINAVARLAFGTSDLTADTELHAADIYHRKRNFKSWPNFNARVGIIVQLGCILSKNEVQLIDIQINCDGLHGGQVPAEIAFMFFCERANDLVKAKKSLGILIGDRESDQLAARFSTTLSGYRANKTDFAFGRNIHNLVDSVHFTHSHLSRFLQLADVYAWLLQFQNRNRKSNQARHITLLKALKEGKVDLFPAKYKKWPRTQSGLELAADGEKQVDKKRV